MRFKRAGVAIGALALIGGLTMCTRPTPESDEESTPPGTSAPTPPPVDGPTAHTPSVVISKITGANALTDTVSRWKVQGTDLGIFWMGDDATLLTAFGDTFGKWSGDGGGGQEWRSNVLLRSSQLNPSDGITFDSAIEEEDGMARELIPSMKLSGIEMTTIPTAAIAVGGRQYMAFMSVNEWGDPGRWNTNFSRIAYSDDLGETWNYEDGPTWENTEDWSHPFQMVAFAQRDADTLYMFGTPNGRAGTVSLARVASDRILERDAWEYWDGSEWDSDEFAVTPLFDSPASELSVIYNRDLDRWVMVTLQEADGLILRTAPEPTGPWSDATLIADPLDHPSLYGGFIHPASATGSDIYYAMSEWRTYSVYLLRVTIDADGAIQRPNLVPDHNFEWQLGDEIGAPWTITGAVKQDTIYGASDHFSGITNARLAEAGAVVSQQIRAEPRTHYEAAAFLSTPDGGSGEFGVRGCDGAVLASAETTGVAGYERLLVSVDSGECEWLEVYARSTGAGPVLVDTFSLAERDG